MGAPRKPVAPRMIEIDITRKSYGDQPVLGNVFLEIPAGDCVAVLGPSGIGKTTLLRIAAGLDQDFEGSVARPERVAMVFQEPTLLPWRTVGDNIKLITGIPDEAVEEALGRVGLEGRSSHLPDQLSLGQRRRLSLARAFAAKPQFLVMDEPFASLDKALANDMIELTLDLLKDASIATLLVTHSENEADRLARSVYRLQGQPATLSQTRL
jgi:NitT/TauT family transport system ATP-binding protein